MLTRDDFISLANSARQTDDGRTPVIPVSVRLLDDQLTPVLAYRRLVAPDQRTEPSFLLESVEGGERQGRHSILGARPAIEVLVSPDGHAVEIRTHGDASPGVENTTTTVDDPFDTLRDLTNARRLVRPDGGRGGGGGAGLPNCLIAGWVGYAAYDTVRWAEPDKLGDSAPPDDRGLPTLHFAYYDGAVVFDHVDKIVHVVKLAEIPPDADDNALAELYDRTLDDVEARATELQDHVKPLPSGRLDLDQAEPTPLESNITPEEHAGMVDRALEYIRAGDIFQVVIGQRFTKRSKADPFDVYRALRAVNPSPYMVYLQAKDCILVASSPEILCRVVHDDEGTRTVTNRPLAGTRRRGRTEPEDKALEVELLDDPKERAEHTMLVDLGRNDVGRVCKPGTVETPNLMVVERYSHVMHISSTVTGELRDDLDNWAALRAALPVGTVSGAPKIRAMQIIDELEPVRRGPYGGGIGYVSLDGDMDIALALRTMVVPVDQRTEEGWRYHLQAAGGIVLDSEHVPEYQETVNKAAALARAIDVAEHAFGDPD